MTAPRLQTMFMNELADRTRPDKFKLKDRYARTLEPDRNSPYPLDRIGSYLRVTKEFLDNWVDFDALLDTTAQNPDIARAIDGIPRQDALLALRLAACDCGTHSYTPEWLNPKTQTHLEVINTAAEGVVIANQILKETLREHLIDTYMRKGRYTLLDVGPGNGGTILPVIEMAQDLNAQGKIPTDYRRKLNLILFDVTPFATHLTCDRLKAGTPTRSPLDNVESITSNFVDAQEALKPHAGTIDAVISGGAIMHNTNKDPFFLALQNALSPRGKLAIWDWSAGYTWAAPRLRIGPERGYVGNGLYQIQPDDVTPIEENFVQGWMGPHGLFGYHSPAHRPLQEKLARDFQRQLASHDGFSIIDWLKDNTHEIPTPTEHTPYHLIEGYGPSSFYTDSMRKAGFANPQDRSFKEIYKMSARKKPIEEISCANALFFATAEKTAE